MANPPLLSPDGLVAIGLNTKQESVFLNVLTGEQRPLVLPAGTTNKTIWAGDARYRCFAVANGAQHLAAWTRQAGAPPILKLFSGTLHP